MEGNYTIEYYKNSKGKEPVMDFIIFSSKKVKAKIFVYINLLKNKGRLKHPYARHVKDKIWELRVDFAKNYYRIFYFIFTKKRIILLHAFSKKTNKTPRKELEKAINSYKDFLNSN
ncbi:MAG: type II toxin-antitoxin system RelE/ParE family toxin [Patescibacteria group bacterium]